MGTTFVESWNLVIDNGSATAPPVVLGDFVFQLSATAGVDVGDETPYVDAVNIDDGSVVWSYTGAYGAGTYITGPAAGDGNIYLIDNGNLVALSATNGTIVQTFSGTFRGSPVACDGGVLFALNHGANAISALDPSNGSTAWVYPGPEAPPLTASIGSLALSANGSFIYFVAGARLYCIDVTTSVLQFITPSAPISLYNRWAPVVAQGIVVVGESTLNGLVLDAIDSFDGSLKWSWSLGNLASMPQPVASEDGNILFVYVYTSNSPTSPTVIALDLTEPNGDLLWSYTFPTPGTGVTLAPTQLVVDGQEVFAITTSTAALTSVLSVTALLDGQITGTTSLTVASPNQPLGGALGDGTLVLSSTAGPTAFTYAQTPQQILSVGQNPFAIVGYTETMVFVSTAAGITPIIAGDTGWSVQQAIPMPMNSWLPWGLAMNPEATLVAIACQSGNNGLVVFFDPSSKQMLGNVVIEGTARQNAGTLELAFTLDGNYVFATNEYINTVSVIQVNGGTSPALAATVAVGLTPTGIAMDANYAYVICQDAAAQLQVIDIATAITNPSVSIVATVSAGTDPVRIVLGSTGGEDYAWVSDRGGNAVLTFNTADLISSPGSGPLATTPVGIAPVGLLLFGGGDYIAVSNSNRFSNPLSDGTMTVLDTTTVLSQSGSSVVATVNAHLFPREFGAVPDGSTFFLTNFSSGEVMVFDADQFIS